MDQTVWWYAVARSDRNEWGIGGPSEIMPLLVSRLNYSSEPTVLLESVFETIAILST